MTKEQAYERLELPIDSDLQIVRQKFAAMHNDYRMQIDNAFNSTSKQTFEQKLEELKEAYATLNESDGMDDSAELPRTGKSVEEKQSDDQEIEHEPEKWPLDKALALFGLSVNHDTDFIRNTLLQYQKGGTKKLDQNDSSEEKEALGIVNQWLSEERKEDLINEKPSLVKKTTGFKNGILLILLMILIAGGICWFLFNNSIGYKSIPNDSTSIQSVENDESVAENITVPNWRLAYLDQFEKIQRMDNQNSEKVITAYKELLATLPSDAVEERTMINKHIASLKANVEKVNSPKPKEKTNDIQEDSHSQSDKIPDKKADAVSEDVFIDPVPPGGMREFLNWVASNYVYPQSALDAGVKGRVHVKFVVDTQGQLMDFEVERDLGYGTGNELIRVLKQSQKWKPGIQNGKPVRVAYSIPLNLNME